MSSVHVQRARSALHAVSRDGMFSSVKGTRDDPLLEHKAALAKIDGAVALSASKAGDALACKRGCSACCVDGLSVLPVEAALIASSGLAAPSQPSSQPGMCAFLDDDGACSVYPVRPVLCRTHGLALRSSSSSSSSSPPSSLDRRPGLRILDDVSACELNYTTRAPTRDDILDGNTILALVVTVDRRYRNRVGLPDDPARIALRDLAARVTRSS